MPRCSTNPKNNYEVNRYVNKTMTSNERALFSQWWEELVNRYGTRVEYYTYNYSLTTHDYLYGEEPTASYSGPYYLNMMIEIPSESIMLSKFGFQTNADFTGVITIEDFQSVFGVGAEPKSQDVVRAIEMGWRTDELPPTTGDIMDQICSKRDPSSAATIMYTVSDVDFVRCPYLFEITERRWQDLSMNINTLLGHYVWVIEGKRFDYSYQPGLIPECNQDQITDDSFTGILSGGSQDQSPDKIYEGDADTDVKDNIWDYDEGDSARDDNVYGEY